MAEQVIEFSEIPIINCAEATIDPSHHSATSKGHSWLFFEKCRAPFYELLALRYIVHALADACQNQGQKNHAQTPDKVTKADVKWDRQRDPKHRQGSKPKSSPTEQEYQRDNPKEQSPRPSRDHENQKISQNRAKVLRKIH